MEIEINWPRSYVVLPILMIVFIIIGLMLINNLEPVVKTIESVETVDVEIVEYEHGKIPANLSELEHWPKDDIYTLYYDTLDCFFVKRIHPSYDKCRKILRIWAAKKEWISDPANTELLDQIEE